METIEVHYDYTSGTEVSYQEGLAIVKQGKGFTTCCLEFVCSDYLKTHRVIVITKRRAYIDLEELMDNTGIYTDKEIRPEHNLRKMLVANAFNWVQAAGVSNAIKT